MTAVNPSDHAMPATTFGFYFGSDGAEVVVSVATIGIADADVIYVVAAACVAGALATDLQIYGQPYSDVVRFVMEDREDRENSSRFGLVGMGKQLPPIPSGSGSGYVKTLGVAFPTNTISIFAVENFSVACANRNVVAPQITHAPDLDNSGCLSLGPHDGGNATPMMSHSNVHVLLRQCWLIGKTRSVGSPDLLPVTTSLDVSMQGLTETANGFDTLTDGQVLNHGEKVR